MRRILLAVLAIAAIGYYFWSTFRNVEMVLVPDPKPQLDRAREAAQRIEADGQQRVHDVLDRTGE